MVSFSEPEIDLSIVIVSYNTKGLLKKCLESIFKFQKDLIFEVILVDNRSADKSAIMVREKFPQVRMLENKRNLGFAAACNQGIKISRGRFLLLLNPDTEFTRGGITEMIRFMESQKRVGICGPRMEGPDGRVHFSCRSFPTYLTAISSGQSMLNRIFPGNPLSTKYLLTDRDRTKESEVDWVSGSGLLTKRKVFEKIGSLDDLFFMYVEDVDFCYRTKKANFTVYYFPQVTVLHHIGKSTKRQWILMLAEHHRSMYNFYRKHHHPNLLFRGVVFWGIWVRLWFTILTGFFVTKGR
jgi:GT2 family glycosyltransferase